MADIKHLKYEEKNYPDGMCEFTGTWRVSKQYLEGRGQAFVNSALARIIHDEIGVERFPGYALKSMTAGSHWDEKEGMVVVTWAFQVPINSLAMSEEELLWIT